MAAKYTSLIVGFKVAHYNKPDWVPIDRAIEAGKMAGNPPIIVDFGGGGLSLEDLTMRKLFILIRMVGEAGDVRE